MRRTVQNAFREASSLLGSYATCAFYYFIFRVILLKDDAELWTIFLAYLALLAALVSFTSFALHLHRLFRVDPLRESLWDRVLTYVVGAASALALDGVIGSVALQLAL